VGKTVAPEVVRGTVVRLGRRRLEARLAGGLPPLTNVRLRLTYPLLGHDSRDLYGKVVAGADQELTSIRLTSVDPADERIIEGFLAG
jgi:hypothetical protein